MSKRVKNTSVPKGGFGYYKALRTNQVKTQRIIEQSMAAQPQPLPFTYVGVTKMKREIRGITFFCVVWEIIIFGAFISANEFGIKNLVQAYEWFFYLMTALAILAIFFGSSKPTCQYTKAKFHWEILVDTLLGIMLAYYGYFVCASVLMLFGYAVTQKNYLNKEKEDEKTE